MNHSHYRIPFRADLLFEGKDIPTCDLGESIAQHIQLLVTTRFGENRFDPDYGNGIWQLEFERSVSEARWEESFRQSVIKAVSDYESRLMDVDAELKIEMVEKVYPMKKYTEIKKKVVILVRGKLVETGEPYTFRTELYLSPMSID